MVAPTGAEGAKGPRGDPGLTTSVNGVQQVDGNVTLTGDNIPIGVDDSTTITNAVDNAIEMIDKAKETMLSNRTPTGGDNQSKGCEMGDRWLAIPDKLAINLIPQSWDKKESWTIEGRDADNVEFNELSYASGWGLFARSFSLTMCILPPRGRFCINTSISLLNES